MAAPTARRAVSSQGGWTQTPDEILVRELGELLREMGRRRLGDRVPIVWQLPPLSHPFPGMSAKLHASHDGLRVVVDEVHVAALLQPHNVLDVIVWLGSVLTAESWRSFGP